MSDAQHPDPAAEAVEADRESEPADGRAPYVDVYWRPGCGFCMTLKRGLSHGGLEVREINIWDDPEAAAFVRQHARGNETVPTVDVNGTVVVNPPARVVLALAREAGIAVADPPPSRWRRR